MRIHHIRYAFGISEVFEGLCTVDPLLASTKGSHLDSRPSLLHGKSRKRPKDPILYQFLGVSNLLMVGC